MDFKLMKEIIAVLKQQVRCSKCNKRFVHRELDIQDVAEAGMTLACRCSQCQTESFMEIDLKPVKEITQQANQKRNSRNLKVTAKKLHSITTDDVLDMKNFLKDFTGDFKNIFKS
jgi:DNA polymerase II large subunit